MEIFNRENVSDAEWAEYAEQCRKDARDREQAKQENYLMDVWDFYANNIISDYIRKARVADNKGIDWVYGLQDSEGNIVDAEIVDGKYGQVWRVNKADGAVQWVNVSKASTVAKEQAHYAKHGYKIVSVYYHFAIGKYGLYPDKKRGIVEVCELADEAVSA